jgi:hypothetical protein
MTESNFRTYIADTHPLTFDGSSGILCVQASNPLAAEILTRRFHTTIKRAVHNLQLAIGDAPIQDMRSQPTR